ncbi:MAG TPA: energy transducer TonB, partial [Chthoniobacterales bacterium]|nr:energy transducer TonB [Chthoniobacterales bacterium]
GFGARWEIEGTWTVDNGVLIESPTKATPPTRLGPVAKTKIVSLDSDRLMLRDGARVVELRRARVPENLPPISRWVFAMARSAEQRKLFGIETRNPSYPKVTQLKRIEGDGVFRISVNGQGRVAGIEILESTGNATLDGAAVAAFQRWRFTPRTVKELVVPVSFRMRGF